MVARIIPCESISLLFSWNSAIVSRDEICMGGSEASLGGGIDLP